MRRWLRDPVAQTAETALTPAQHPDRKVSALPAVSATPPRVALDLDAWADVLRTGDLPGLTLERWAAVSDALAHLIVTGAAAKALERGWEAFDLIGVQRRPPHDASHVAGLVFGMRPGDVVTDMRRSGCLITYQGGRHVWLRRPLTLDACLPWDLPA